MVKTTTRIWDEERGMENEVFGKMKTLFSERLGARSGHPPDACFFDRAEKEFGEFKSMWGMEDLVVGADGGGDDDESKGGGDEMAPPSALRTSVNRPLAMATSSSTLDKEKTLEMDTGNIAKYTQGSRVEGLGESSNISGVVRRVQPASPGATTGPGKIFLLLDRPGGSGENPNAAGNSAARLAAMEQAKYNSMLKKKKIAARVAFGGAGGGGFITELESKNTTNGPPERLAVCMPCYNEDFFEIEATASDITMMVRRPSACWLARHDEDCLVFNLTHSSPTPLRVSLSHSLLYYDYFFANTRCASTTPTRAPSASPACAWSSSSSRMASASPPTPSSRRWSAPSSPCPTGGPRRWRCRSPTPRAPRS